ncbi:MAG: hypothetical protein RDV41_04565 [Planctomycetota bacterium]|nr:hypothetical protein [Planctomycetota bacterium]
MGRIRWLLVVFFAAAVCVSARTVLAQSKEIEKLIAQYVEASDTDRPAILAKLKARDKISKSDVTKWANFTGKLLLAKGTHEGKDVSTLHDKEHPVKYKLIGNRKGKKMSLLVVLHGGGGTPVNEDAWQNMIAMTEALRPKYDLIAIPRIWSGMEASWGTNAGIGYIPVMIDEIKRTYSIDTNRIYLYGSSMGGYGVSCLGAACADRFAAMAALCSVSDYDGACENLMNTPVTTHMGARDTDIDRIGKARRFKERMEELQKRWPDSYKMLYKEYPDGGHSLPQEATVEMLEWMTRFTRVPLPRTVVWKGFLNAERKPVDTTHFFWLAVESPKAEMRLEAAIKDKGVIEVKTEEVGRFTIFLNDKLVDLNKPLTVTVNGKTAFQGKPALSLSAVVESVVAKEDPEMMFTARIDLGE